MPLTWVLILATFYVPMQSQDACTRAAERYSEDVYCVNVQTGDAIMHEEKDEDEN